MARDGSFHSFIQYRAAGRFGKLRGCGCRGRGFPSRGAA
jgi:hypothetical protein